MKTESPKLFTKKSLARFYNARIKHYKNIHDLCDPDYLRYFPSEELGNAFNYIASSWEISKHPKTGREILVPRNPIKIEPLIVVSYYSQAFNVNACFGWVHTLN